MDWIEDLVQELRFKDLERSQRDALQYQRLIALQDQGPRFFRDLQQQLRSVGAHPAFRDLLFGEFTERDLSVRNSESRPIVKVSAHLNTNGVNVAVATCSSAAVPFTEKTYHRIEFGLDNTGNLSLCMACVAVTLDDVSKLILRHALGLA